MESIDSPSDKIALDFLSSTQLIGVLDQAVLIDIAGELKWFRLEDGEIFLHKDLPARSIYLVYKGFLETFTNGEDGDTVILTKVSPGEIVNEVAVWAGGRRPASVRATGDAIVGRLSQAALARITERHPKILGQLSESVHHRQRVGRLRAIMSKSELFADWSAPARDDLETELEWLTLADGKQFIHEGDAGDFLAILVSGRLQILTASADGDNKLVAELGPGDMVGEMALFTGAPRTTDVKAIRDSEVVKLTKKSFDHLVSKHPHEMVSAFAGYTISTLSDRIQGRVKRRSSLTTLVMVPMSSDVPLSQFASQLVKAFVPLGRTTHLNSRLVDESFDSEGISQTKPNDFNDSQLIAWLNEQEFSSEYLLLEADFNLSPWSARCLRQSDLVLLVGLAGHNPENITADFRQLETGLTSSDTRQSLVLLHDDQTEQPSGTQRWLKRWKVHSFHHVRKSRMADYQRMARIVTGRATGLVLSGGGARGTAHIGVLRALEEADIAIDHIGGNSMGSIISAGYALGYDIDQMHALTREMYKPRNFFNPTIPLVSFFSRRGMVRFAKKIMGDRQIEDLWMPYFCVSSNLTQAEVAVHDSGPMLRWVLASNSLPGLLPPVVHQGDLFYDGALLDDLPLDIMREKIGAGTVIAVDVSPPVDLAENPDIGLHLSGWQVLWSRINPWMPAINLPNIAAVLQRAGELSSKRSQRILVNAQLADLYLRPPVEQFSITDARELDKIVEIGYESAVEKIGEWKLRNTKPKM